MRIKHILKLLRPHQWIKNSFVLAPLVFAGKFLSPEALKQALLAFLAFCVASSATYVLNDLKDIEKDRKHPVKCQKRPLASGAISPKTAKFILALLYLILAIFLYSPFSRKFMLPILIYLVLNIFYSYRLKYIPILDIFCIAIGFVLRIFAGGMAISVPISSWMLITTLCLALFLASAKRLQELRVQGNNTRKVLQSYTLKLLESYAQISAAGALVFYSLFVITSRPRLALSVPFVIFGLFRYWFIVEAQGQGESPTEALLKDIPLGITVILWILFCLWRLWPEGAFSLVER